MPRKTRALFDSTDFLRAADEDLRAGRVGDVRDRLAALNLKSIEREDLARIAQLFVRAGLFADAQKILLPFVHPMTKLDEAATDLEKAVHAFALIKIGSMGEATDLLESVSPDIPERDLYTAFARIGVWDYEGAVAPLRHYLSRPGLSDYEASVARVNLLSSLIAVGERDEAGALLGLLRTDVEKNQWTLLRKNTQELSGQFLARFGDLREARRELAKATGENADGGTIWDFLVAKWLAFVALRFEPDSPQARRDLSEVRKRASELGHSETVRDCDRLLAQAAHDEQLLHRVYFGTPHRAFRERLEREADWFRPAAQFTIGSGSRVFDRDRAMATNGEFALKPGQALHRALSALTSDLYKPLYLGNLHAILFPGDYFNAASSPDRVLNVIKRLRLWIQENSLPLALPSAEGSYRLEWDESALGFLYAREEGSAPAAAPETERGYLRRLQAAFADGEFTCAEAALALGISKSSATKILTWALDQNEIRKEGIGRSTRYFVGPDMTVASAKRAA